MFTLPSVPGREGGSSRVCKALGVGHSNTVRRGQLGTKLTTAAHTSVQEMQDSSGGVLNFKKMDLEILACIL